MFFVDNCPICKSENTVFVRDDIKECLDCMHKFKNIIPEGFLDRYYDVKYWENDKIRQGIQGVKDGEYWNGWVGARMST